MKIAPNILPLNAFTTTASSQTVSVNNQIMADQQVTQFVLEIL